MEKQVNMKWELVGYRDIWELRVNLLKERKRKQKLPLVFMVI